MGWMYNIYSMDNFNKKEILRESISGKILKDSFVGTTYYAAVETESGDVVAVIIPTRMRRKPYGVDFGYKFMDESYEPGEAVCPIGILKLLTETSNEHANEWRKRCYANAERKKTGVSNLPLGTKIQVTVDYDSDIWNCGDVITVTKQMWGRYKNPIWKVDGHYVRISAKELDRMGATVVE